MLHLDENHVVTVLYKPRKLRLRGFRKRDGYALMARSKDGRTLFRWAMRLEFAIDAFPFAPLSVALRSNDVGDEIQPRYGIWNDNLVEIFSFTICLPQNHPSRSGNICDLSAPNFQAIANNSDVSS